MFTEKERSGRFFHQVLVHNGEKNFFVRKIIYFCLCAFVHSSIHDEIFDSSSYYFVDIYFHILLI